MQSAKAMISLIMTFAVPPTESLSVVEYILVISWFVRMYDAIITLVHYRTYIRRTMV